MMISTLDMEHCKIECYRLCIKADSGLTLIYFTARSNLDSNAFKRGKLLESHYWEKTYMYKNDEVTEGLCSYENLNSSGLSVPAPGLSLCIYEYDSYFSNVFSKTARPIKAKLHAEHSWEGGNEIFI